MSVFLKVHFYNLQGLSYLSDMCIHFPRASIPFGSSFAQPYSSLKNQIGDHPSLPSRLAGVSGLSSIEGSAAREKEISLEAASVSSGRFFHPPICSFLMCRFV